MPRISIFYRGSDAAVTDGPLFDRVTARFGKDAEFMDVDDIPFGVDFREHINNALAEIDLLVVVIGPKWIGADRRGRVRIEEINDPIRIVVETALARGVPVVPIHVEGTTMPASAAPPESLSALPQGNAAEANTRRNFHPHMDRLIRSMDKIPKELSSRTSNAARLASSRVPKEAVVVSLIAILAISVGTAWYLSHSPHGKANLQAASIGSSSSASETKQGFFDQAKRIATAQAWERAKQTATLSGWDDFLAKVASGVYQAGPLSDQAREERAKLVTQATQAAFNQARRDGTVEAWDNFLSKIDSGEYQNGPLADQARKARAKIIGELRTQKGFEKAKRTNTLQAWDDFLAKIDAGEYQKGPMADQARQERTKLQQTNEETGFWNSIKDSKKQSLYQAYLGRYPTGTFADIAKAHLQNFETVDLPGSTETFSDKDVISDPGLLKELRGRLYDLNFDPGPPDGSDIGAINAAIHEFEQKNALPVTDAPSMGLLRRLRAVGPLKPWGAIVYDAKRKKWGMSWGKDTRADAVAHAQLSCDAGSSCPIELSFFGTECAAFAHSESGWAIVARGDIGKAKEASTADCAKRGEACRIIASVCADGRFRIAR